MNAPRENSAKRRIALNIFFIFAITSLALIQSLLLHVARTDFGGGELANIIAPPIPNDGKVTWSRQRVDVKNTSDERPESSFRRAHTDPVPIYTERLAKEAVGSGSWQCGRGENVSISTLGHPQTIFVFVHIYKTAGTTLRKFFGDLAYACEKTWLGLARCTEVSLTSLKTKSDSKIWQKCALESLVDGVHGTRDTFKHYRRVPAKIIPRSEIFGGHLRIGTGDFIFSSSSQGYVRYIVFLRSPEERYVSGVLYQNKERGRHETLDQVAKKIKKRVAKERSKDRYWFKSSSYLLTPDQRDANPEANLASSGNTTQSYESFAAKLRANLAIRNLFRYNAIIGFAERMPESLGMLKHVLVSGGPDGIAKRRAEDVVKRFAGGNSSSAGARDAGVQANRSSKRDVSTLAVIAELRKDKDHMRLFRDYVMYEQMITDYAWHMHMLQYNATVSVTSP